MGKKARNYGAWGSGSGGVRQDGQVPKGNANQAPQWMRQMADREHQAEHLRHLAAKLSRSCPVGERRHG